MYVLCTNGMYENTTVKMDFENDEETEKTRDNNGAGDRVSKKKSRVMSKAILETLNADKDLIDLSDDPSDYEDDLKKEKQKRFQFSSDDDNEIESKKR